MASLLETEDPKVLRDELLKAWQRQQELERVVVVLTTLIITTADDTLDYLDRPEPNIPPVMRKARYMKEVAQRQRDK